MINFVYQKEHGWVYRNASIYYSKITSLVVIWGKERHMLGSVLSLVFTKQGSLYHKIDLI